MALRWVGLVGVAVLVAACGGPALLSVDDVLRRLDRPGIPAVEVIQEQRDLPAGVPLAARIEPPAGADGDASFSILVFERVPAAEAFEASVGPPFAGTRVRNVVVVWWATGPAADRVVDALRAG